VIEVDRPADCYSVYRVLVRLLDEVI